MTQLAYYALKVERDISFLLEGGWRGRVAADHRRGWIERVRTGGDPVSGVPPWMSLQ